MLSAELVMHKDSPDPGHQPPDDELLAAYREGEERAAAVLFERYYFRLLALVRQQMGTVLHDAEESSDIAQSVFESVFLRGRDYRIRISPDDGLWPVLVTITVNKIRNRAKFWTRQRRDRRREVSLEDCDPLEAGPSPDDAARLQDLIGQLLEPFDDLRRQIIRSLLQDLPVPEIAARLSTSKRTVYRTRQAAMQILGQILAAS